MRAYLEKLIAGDDLSMEESRHAMNQVMSGEATPAQIGGLLMGFGGITALGCTIGQGITGFSTLALGSIVTLVFIVIGSAATMKYQYWRAG